MAINLEFDSVRHSVKVALRERLAIWRAETNMELADKLSTMITETLFDVAATSRSDGTEKGVIEGLRMIKNWED